MTFDPDDGAPPPAQEGGSATESDPEPRDPAPERVRTGSDVVDDVIRAVEELDDRPVEEHAAVFEQAQARLRRALDEPGDADDVVTREDGFDGALGHDDHSDHP
jgi:hypothetical protein